MPGGSVVGSAVMVTDSPFVANWAESQFGLAPVGKGTGAIPCAVTPEAASVPCPLFDSAIVAVCTTWPCTPVKDTGSGVATRMGSVVTLSVTAIDWLSGANAEPLSVIVAVDWPVAMFLAAVAVTLYGTLNVKVPSPFTAMDNHGLGGATVAVTGDPVVKSCVADPPGGR